VHDQTELIVSIHTKQSATALPQSPNMMKKHRFPASMQKQAKDTDTHSRRVTKQTDVKVGDFPGNAVVTHVIALTRLFGIRALFLAPPKTCIMRQIPGANRFMCRASFGRV
jgi:hypothetical protein